MIGYPPMVELYLGCECMDLGHVALFINFPPKKDNDGKVIIDEDDPPCIYFTVTANNYFTQLLPDLDPRCLFEEWTWSTFAHYNWYNRLWIAGKHIFNPTYIKRYGILDAFDFQERDHSKLDMFLSLISSDIDTNIDDKSELWLDDERWRIRLMADRWVCEEHDIKEPWKVGWDVQFMKRGFWGRIRWGLKYIFGRHCPEKQFAILEKDAAKIRGMIKWAQEENKREEAKEEETKEIAKWVVDMSKSEEGISEIKKILTQVKEEDESKSN